MFSRIKLQQVAFLFVLMLFFVPAISLAQDTKDVNARSPKPVPVSRIEKKALSKKKKQADLTEKAIEKGRKRHEKIQTRDVRKRMKKSKNVAGRNNANKKDFFLKRWFEPKRRTKKR